MMPISALIAADPVKRAMLFGDDDRPVYARAKDGSMHQLDAVEDGQIETSSGQHDVIVLVLGAQKEGTP